MANTVARESAPPTVAEDSRQQILLIALLTVAGAALRLSHLEWKSLWLDEAITLQMARMPWREFASSFWHRDAAYQSLYYLFMRVWSPGAYSEFWLRLPSAIFGAASIPVIYLLAKRLATRAVAVAAAALLTFSTTHVYYSQEARGYTLAILVVLLSYDFFVRALEQDRRRYWLLWSLCSILAVYAHDFAALAILAQPCSLLFGKGPVPWRRLGLYGLILAAGVTPVLSFVLREPAVHFQYWWMPKASPQGMLELAMFLGGTHLRFVLIVVLWAAGIWALVRARYEHDDRRVRAGSLVLLWFLMPVAIMALLSAVHPVFMQRYMIFSLPAALIFAAMGTAALQRWNVGMLLVVVLCVSSAIAVVKQSREPHTDWRSAAKLVLSSARPRDAILFYPDYSALPFNYYRDRFARAPELRVFSTQPATDASRAGFDSYNFQQVWIVLTGDSRGIEGLPDRDAALNSQLQSAYGPPAVSRFKDITVLRFARKASPSKQ